MAAVWSILLFATVVWISLVLQSQLDIASQIGGSSGLAVARVIAVLLLPSWPVTWILVGLALSSLAATFLAARRRDLPAWAVEPPQATRPAAVAATPGWTVTVCGLVAGIVGASRHPASSVHRRTGPCL